MRVGDTASQSRYLVSKDKVFVVKVVSVDGHSTSPVLLDEIPTLAGQVRKIKGGEWAATGT
jgi:hypothetical protein